MITTGHGTFESYAAYQAAREANPSESDLQCWEESARNSLQYRARQFSKQVRRRGGHLSPQEVKEHQKQRSDCFAYTIACDLVRATPGLGINAALDLAFEALAKAATLAGSAEVQS